KAYLLADKPVVCWIRYGSGLHCVCITGYDEQNFYYNDPYGGKDRAVSYATLASIRASLGNRALSY
ncbi:MAG: C39 family peptidase, partial [Coriobacteriales bacterium]|nr:C39 family peptidase [Coriobacteriales bacterium]